jgi:aspartate racemase
MKKFCLIGGMGPQATILYYNLINAKYRSLVRSENYPEFIVINMNLYLIDQFMEIEDYLGLTDYLLNALHRAYDCGTEFAAMGANTPHQVFPELREKSPLPLISIVKATGRRADKLNLKKSLLLGTKYTMQLRFYPQNMKEYGVEVVVPGEEEQNYIHRKIFSELDRGMILSETRSEFLNIVAKSQKKHRIDSVILGCTEIPLLISENNIEDIKVLNTAAIPVDEIVDEILKS